MGRNASSKKVSSTPKLVHRLCKHAEIVSYESLATSLRPESPPFKLAQSPRRKKNNKSRQRSTAWPTLCTARLLSFRLEDFGAKPPASSASAYVVFSELLPTSYDRIFLTQEDYNRIGLNPFPPAYLLHKNPGSLPGSCVFPTIYRYFLSEPL